MFLFLPVLKTECLTLALSGLDCGRDEELRHVSVLTCLHRFCTRAAARSPVKVMRHPPAPPPEHAHVSSGHVLYSPHTYLSGSTSHLAASSLLRATAWPGRDEMIPFLSPVNSGEPLPPACGDLPLPARPLPLVPSLILECQPSCQFPELRAPPTIPLASDDSDPLGAPVEPEVPL